MSTYKVTTDQGVFNITTDDGVSGTSNTPNMGTSQTGSLSNPMSMDSTIANRPSLLKNALQSPIDLQQHPFKRILQDAGAGFEAMEGVPASVGLDLQQGKLQNIIPNIGQVVSGNRPAQRGDILRSIGIPEPLAAAGGFMSGMTPVSSPTSSSSMVGKAIQSGASLAKYLPENIAMNALTKGIGDISNVSGITSAINNIGKPVLAKGLSLLSGVPNTFVNKALNNPEILSPRWLAKEGNVVSQQYKDVVQPLIDDSSKTINVNSAKNIAQDIGMVNKDYELTRGFRKMTPSEQNKVSEWENQLVRGGNKTFNDVDGMLGEMDAALKKTYTQTDKGAIPNFSNDGQRIINQMQGKLRAIRDAQYPDAGRVLDRYSNFKNMQNISNTYNKVNPHLVQTIANSGIGWLHNPTLSSVMAINAFPKAQAALIRMGGFGTETAKGALLGGSSPEAMFNLWRNAQMAGQ